MDDENNLRGIISMQGANRINSLIKTIDFEPNKIQTEDTSKAEIREMGVSRNPSRIEGVGGKEVNTEASVNTVFPPEVGKGTLISSIV